MNQQIEYEYGIVFFCPCIGLAEDVMMEVQS